MKNDVIQSGVTDSASQTYTKFWLDYYALITTVGLHMVAIS